MGRVHADSRAGSDWQRDAAGQSRDLSGHFRATLRALRDNDRTVWSCTIIGHESQVPAAGQTGNQSAAEQLVEERDRWVRGGDTVLDATENPPAIATDRMIYVAIWPPWR
jgi:hypothetical protein